jgi:hypothetical protein
MIVSKNKKTIGKIVDLEGGLSLVMFSLSKDEAEEFLKTKMWEAFEKGMIMIGYDPTRKQIITHPSVVELIKRKMI